MTPITYAYKVIKSSPESKTMEVEYTAAGYPTMLVGMPLPTNDGDINTIIAQYAPIHRWVETTATVVPVPIGTTGVVSYTPLVATPVQNPIPNQTLVPNISFEDRVLAVLTKYGVSITTPTVAP